MSVVRLVRGDAGEAPRRRRVDVESTPGPRELEGPRERIERERAPAASSTPAEPKAQQVEAGRRDGLDPLLSRLVAEVPRPPAGSHRPEPSAGVDAEAPPRQAAPEVTSPAPEGAAAPGRWWGRPAVWIGAAAAVAAVMLGGRSGASSASSSGGGGGGSAGPVSPYPDANVPEVVI